MGETDLMGKVPVFNIERFAIHDGPGIRTTVFLQGCPLRCPWCANPESQEIGPKLLHLPAKCVGCGACLSACPRGAVSLKDGKASIDRGRCIGCGSCREVCTQNALQISGSLTELEEIYRVLIRDRDYYHNSEGGVTFSGGEALLHVRTLYPLVRRLEQEGIPVAVETCGQVGDEEFHMAAEAVSLFLFDIKTADPAIMKQCIGGDLQIVLRNLTYLAEAFPEKVLVRVPVIPGVNHDERAMRDIFRLLEERRIRRVELLPYHTLGMTKYEQLGRACPFQVRKSLDKKELKGYLELGQSMGLQVKIG